MNHSELFGEPLIILALSFLVSYNISVILTIHLILSARINMLSNSQNHNICDSQPNFLSRL